MADLRVAIVHDYLIDAGGAERALIELLHVFPSAPVFTSVYSPSTTLPEFSDCDVRTSFLQPLRVNRGNYKLLLPLFPPAFASLRLHDFDLVVSSSSAFSKCIRRRPGAAHVCYCYTPPRFIYRWKAYREHELMGTFTRAATTTLQPYLRWWDQRGAAGVDRFIAISENVRQRIAENYSRTADVVYPPVELDGIDISDEREDFYLVASRLLPYKRIDTVVDALSRLGRRLVVAGDGPDRARLESAANSSVTFLGRVSDATLQGLYRRCRATILPGEEDLGLTPLEANAAGSPVIALGRGGAVETVLPDVTGIHYDQPTAEALQRAVLRFESMHFDVRCIRRHAERFSRRRFQRGILESIQRTLESMA